MQRNLLISLLLLAVLSISSATFVGQRFQPIRRHSLKQTAALTSEEIHGQAWSQDATVMKRNGNIYIYHNYTVDTDASGRRRVRFTKREVADQPALERRAFAIDNIYYRNGLWSDPKFHAGAPTTIRFCFFNFLAQDTLADGWLEAVCRWNNALGPSRGVRFVVERDGAGQFVCDPADVDGRVQLKADHTMLTQYDAIGTFGGPRYTLSVNTALLPASDGFDIADTFVVQIGHILGLEREHQRFDAFDYLNIDCTQIGGYQALVNSVNLHPENHVWPHYPALGALKGQPLTVADYCTMGELSNSKFIAQLWDGGAYIPLTSSNPHDTFPGTRPSVNAVGDNQFSAQYGAFDPHSVMLYCGSMAGAPHRGQHILRWRGSNAPVMCKLPLMPSAMDVIAVHIMYPQLAYDIDDGPPDAN